MLTTLKKYYSDTLYKNSIVVMLNSAFAAFFYLVFWIVGVRHMPSKGLGIAERRAAGSVQLTRLGLEGTTEGF